MEIKTQLVLGDCLEKMKDIPDNSLDNLQIISWFENKMKKTLSQSEWEAKKERILEYLT